MDGTGDHHVEQGKSSSKSQASHVHIRMIMIMIIIMCYKCKSGTILVEASAGLVGEKEWILRGEEDQSMHMYMYIYIYI
jgi:hypothetical protein